MPLCLQVRDLESDNEDLTSKLETAMTTIEQLNLEKGELVKNLEAEEERQRGTLENERKQFERLLKDAQKAQVVQCNGQFGWNKVIILSLLVYSAGMICTLFIPALICYPWAQYLFQYNVVVQA